MLSLDKIGPSILIEYKDQKFLVDCGFEAVTGLMKVGLKAGQINNMFFTHQHVDHNADFISFFIGGWEEDRSQLTLAGPSVQKLYDVVTDLYQEDINYRLHIDSKPDGMLTNVDIHEFTQDIETFDIGAVRISAIPVPHTITTYAYKFEAGGQKVVVTGDMSYNEQIKKFSEGANIIVIDALQAANFDDVPADFRETLKKNLSRAHIMNEDIGIVAAAASPANLVLVHWSGGLTLENSIDLYREAGYTGHVIKGIDGLVIEP